VLYAVFGSLIIFALFPFLAYEFDAYINVNSYSSYVGPLCVIVAMGAGTLGSIMVSTLINGQLIARDAIHGPIAGAIAVGASSLYITTPVWALVAGCSGGIVQALIQNTIERAAINRRYIISTVSWSLFGLQGIIGAAFATGWKAIAYGSRLNSLTPDASVLADNNVQFEFYAGLISAGIGAGFGVLAGLLIFIFNGQTASQYFEDYFYWQGDDGLRVPTDKS
jgi:ammonia channel protein AmtB